MIPRKTPVEQPPKPQPPSITRRPPSESALRSIAATTTVNTFPLRTRPISTTNLFATATTTITTAPTNFQFRGFDSNKASIALTK